MTLTPLTDAARQSLAVARDLLERRQSQDPVQQIRERAALEVNGATLIALGEMLDLECDAGRIAFVASDVLGSALASVVMTLSHGNERAAMDCIALFIAQIGERARAHARAAPEHVVIEVAANPPMAGRA